MGRAEVAVDLQLRAEARAAVAAATDLVGRVAVGSADDVDGVGGVDDVDWNPLRLRLATLRLQLVEVVPRDAPLPDAMGGVVEATIAARDDCHAALQAALGRGRESAAALVAVAEAVDRIERAAGTGTGDLDLDGAERPTGGDELWDQVARLADFGVDLTAERHVPMEVARAQLDLVLGSLHARRGGRGTSFRLAVPAQRRPRRLRRRGVLVAPPVLFRAGTTGWAPTTGRADRSLRGRVRYPFAYVADLARTAWGFRVEATPLLVGAGLLLLGVVLRLSWGVEPATDVAGALDRLIELGLVAAVVVGGTGLATLCWLTPRRRREGWERRRRRRADRPAGRART